jgi:glycosyltransferase involved in cell wall biosynthesis
MNKADGNDVLILASTETMLSNGKLVYMEPSEYINDDGIKVIRIPYSSFLPQKLMKKVRSYKGTINHIEKFKPDVILFHGASAYEIIKIAKYKKQHPKVKLYVDNHAYYVNTARDFISRNILHGGLYKYSLKKALPYIDKLLCISLESYDFVHDLYHVPTDKLELYPLGGIIYEGDEYCARRDRIRTELRLGQEDILIVHSGKMDPNKRTEDLLIAFNKVKSDKLSLVLIGDIPDDMKDLYLPLIKSNSRVRFLGWKSSEELLEYLCAADLYAQPGSQSVTMQNALCCGCPVLLYPHKSHEIYLKRNGFFAKSVDEMADVFDKINSNPSILKDMHEESYNIAHKLLDYKMLAARLYQ